MPQDAVVYSVNLILGAILAGLMSQHWRLSAGGDSLRFWIAAAWTLTLADLLFVLRAGTSSGVMRMLPTLTVTAGHAILLLAAQRTTGRLASVRLAAAIVGVHAALLAAFVAFPAVTSWRTVTNGVVWGSLSLAAAAVLWRDAERARRAMSIPMVVLAAQGAFHVVRTLLATRVVVRADGAGGALVQLLGDLEVSLFMVALFVSVLVAYLRQSTIERAAALDDVRRLSAMLPICAWCNNVRDDDGYWTRIEQYLAAHRVSVTHSICESCAAHHFQVAGTQPSGPAARD